MADKAHVIICGAGIAGVSAAYFLSKAGIQDILLLDERPPLTLTSDRSTECYRNWWPDPALLALTNRSIDLMEQLAEQSGNAFRMNRRGYLYVTADQTRLVALQEAAEQISLSGGGPLRVHEKPDSAYIPLNTEEYRNQPSGADLLLCGDLLQRHFPGLNRSARAGLHVRRAGWVSAQQLGMLLFEMARAAGVRYRTARVSEVRLTGGVLKGVTLSNREHIDCEVFINAAGPFFKQVGNLMGVSLPVTTEVHLKVVFEDHLRAIDRRAPLLIWNDPQYLPWQENERAMLESDPETHWLTDVFPAGVHTRPEGTDESSSVLMLWDYRTREIDPVFPVPMDNQYPEIALRGLSSMLPALQPYIGRSPRPSMDGGYYVKTRENRPLIGKTPIEGCFLIGALSGYGIMAACAAGELLAAYVAGTPLPDYADACSLARYEDAQYVAQLERWTQSGEL